jgi:hypothetical protein
MSPYANPIAMWGQRHSGTLIGAFFCLVVLANQLFILPQLLPDGDPALRLLRSVVYWFALLSVVVHVFLWATYAALVTAVARIVFEGAGTVMRFAEAFRCAGWAHGPLVAWGLLVGAVWIVWGSAPEPAATQVLFAVYAATRTTAYLLGVVLMATLLYRRRHDRTFAAALMVACAPALGLWLGLFLLNGAVGAFVRVS